MTPSRLSIALAQLRSLGSVAVAFSGGVDSTLVLKLAVDSLGPANVLAVTGVSRSLASRELDDARRLAALIGAPHVLIETHEFENPAYLANPVNRCYHCKTELYTRMRPLLAEHGLAVIINGTNADDLGDYRPGLAAAGEHGVRSPLAEAGLTKPEIRALSASMGLPTADKPAGPCLSSRLPYGEAVTPMKLDMIERAEEILRGEGFAECRVRHHAHHGNPGDQSDPGHLARIEVPADKIDRLADPQRRGRIAAAFREIGYAYVTLDLVGFRSGSLNELIHSRSGSLNEVIAFGRRQGPLSPSTDSRPSSALGPASTAV